MHFCKRGRRGNARTIADAVVGADPGAGDRARLSGHHRDPGRSSGLCSRHRARSTRRRRRGSCSEIEAGRTVAVLCEGDPFFYGSFMHLWRRLKDRRPDRGRARASPACPAPGPARARRSPGATTCSPCAGNLPEADLARHLAADRRRRGHEARTPPAEGARRAEGGRALDRAIYVERGTMADERIVPLPELPEKVPDSEKLAVLPYKIGDLAGFRVVRTARERHRDPDAWPERRGRRCRAAVPADRRSRPASSPKPEERDTFARRLFSSAPGIKDIKIFRAEPLRIGQAPGYEIVAEAKDAKSGIDVNTVQWLRFGQNGHLQMFAIARRTAWNDVFPRLRAIRDGIEPRWRLVYCAASPELSFAGASPRRGAFGPPLATPTSAGRSTRSPIV